MPAKKAQRTVSMKPELAPQARAEPPPHRARKRFVNTNKAGPPLAWGNTVPEVGLELDFSPCKHWAVPEHSESDAVRTDTSRSDGEGVHIVHTLLFALRQVGVGHETAYRRVEPSSGRPGAPGSGAVSPKTEWSG